MLEVVERHPTPERCTGCTDDCGSCDYALDRWTLAEEQPTEMDIRADIYISSIDAERAQTE